MLEHLLGMKNIFLLLVLAVFCACNKEDNEVDLLRMTDGTEIEVQKDTLLVIRPELMFAYNRIASPQGFDIDTSYGTTYQTDNNKWVKLRFDKADKDFEANRTYYAKSISCVQEIVNKTAVDFIPFYTSKYKTGFIPNTETGHMQLGYIVEEEHNDVTKCKTNIFYIGYDENKTPLRKYFPCRPNQLVWYTIKK